MFLGIGIDLLLWQTGRDVSKRNALEHFLLILFIQSRVQYKTAHGIHLDLFQILRTCPLQHCVSQGGYIRKSQSICNFHKCLEVILNPLTFNQGTTNPIHTMFVLETRFALCHIFFAAAYVMSDGLSSDKMCSKFLGYSNVNQLSRIFNVSCDGLIIQSVIAYEFQCIG